MTNTDLNDSLEDLLDGAPTGTAKVLSAAPEMARVRAAAETYTETCPKCRGTGRFVSYSGRMLGECFACKGRGSKSFRTAPEVRAQARQRTAVAKAAVVADHQAELKWLADTLARRDRLPEGYATMLADFQTRLLAGHALSDKQMAVIAKGMERSAQWAAERAQKAAERAAAAPEADASKVLEAFQRARASGLKFVCLRLQGLIISEARKHPGTLYVKTSGGQYLGKIADGRFVASRECSPELQAKVLLVASDPATAAKTYGLETGQCSCCGRELTNKASIELGIGPICAEKWGF